jgi:hypothetical protein
MRTLFDDDVFGSQSMELLEGGGEIIVLSQLVRFTFVEHEAIDAAE